MLTLLPVAVVAIFVALLVVARRAPAVRGLVVELTPVVVVAATALSAAYLFAALVEIGPPALPMAAASGLAVAALPAIVPARGRAAVAGAVTVVVALLTLADVVYWRFFGGLMPLLAIGSAPLIGDVGDSISELLERRDLALAPLFLVGLALPFTPRLARGRATTTPPLSKPPARFLEGLTPTRVTALLALVTFLGGVTPVAVDVGFWLDHRFSWKVFNWKMSFSAVGLIGSHARDIARSARENWIREPPSDEELAELTRFAASRTVPVDETFGRDRGLSVVVVQVEAMQDFAVFATVNGARVMPFLHGLIEERATLYTGLWDQTGGSPTSDCEYAVMNALHPLAQGSVAFRRPGNDFVALPRLFDDAGYTTFSAHAYNRGMWNRAIVHPAYGFASSAFDDAFAGGRRVGWGLGDVDFFKRALAMVREQPAPTFSFLITLTSHHPYKYVPKPWRKLKPKALRGPLADYLHSMRYVDEALAVLFAELEKAQRADSTVVVIYGDHDSKLTFSESVARAAERDLGFDAQRATDLSKRAWRTKKIPLVIVSPRASEPRVIDDVGGQIDIGPTILHLMGIEKPRAMLGRALTGGDTSRFVARTDGSAVDATHVLDLESGEAVCTSRATGERVAREECAPLAARVAEELSVSERITLEDLARRITDAESPAIDAAPALLDDRARDAGPLP